MTSASGHYDQNLLAAAQAPTRAQMQEGYNADLLRPNRSTPVRNDTDPESVRSRSNPTSKEHLPMPATQSTKAPFWRTRKGIIIIAIAAIVVIGAVVGGAVGGTVGKNNDNDDATTTSSSSSSSSIPVGPTVSGNSDQPIASGTGSNGESPSPSATLTSTNPVESNAGGSISNGP